MRNKHIFVLLGISLLITVSLGIVIGTSSVGISDSVKAFFAGIGIGDASAGDIAIVHGVRIPGILVAILAGSALGLAGWLSQTLFRNDLADPYIAGIGSGAIFGVNITLLLGLQLGLLGMSAISVSAFIGSLLACLLIWIIAGRTGSTGVSLVLAGVALSFVLSGVNYLIVMYGRDILSKSVFWSWNGLASASYNDALILVVALIFSISIIPFFLNGINAYLLGDEISIYLGVDPKKIRRILFLLVALLTGTAVATSGLLGFVGLIIPHISRKLFGADSKQMLPGSLLLGGSVLGFAYVFGKAIIPHQQIPASVVMSIVGGIFFLYLVIRRPTW